MNCDKDQILPESKEHSFYLMQTLRIENSECLTFFDPGANTHLIDGNIAEREGLQLISDNISTIRVVGGLEIKTERGPYPFNLGPGEDKVYHEIVAIGSLLSSQSMICLRSVKNSKTKQQTKKAKQYFQR